MGACGLQLYRFGQTVSLVFFTPTWRPDSWHARVAANRAAGLHTLVLLDIRVKEPSEASLARGRPVFEPPRYMSAHVAARQLLETEERLGLPGAYGQGTRCVAIARLGRADQRIVAATLGEMARGGDEGDEAGGEEGEEGADGGGVARPRPAGPRLGPPLHSLVLCGEPLHHIEQEALDELFAWREGEDAGEGDGVGRT